MMQLDRGTGPGRRAGAITLIRGYGAGKEHDYVGVLLSLPGPSLEARAAGPFGRPPGGPSVPVRSEACRGPAGQWQKESKGLSRTYRGPSRDGGRRSHREEFRCRHCGAFVGPLVSGGRHRNHCPHCLHSRHVDGPVPGDRTGHCGGMMEPIGYFVRPKGEPVIVHRCLVCGFERHNRIAADDDMDLVLALPELPPRSSSRRSCPLAQRATA